MIKLSIRNLKTGIIFDKEFESVVKARAFRIKCNYGNKLRIISAIGFNDASDLEYYQRGGRK